MQIGFWQVLVIVLLLVLLFGRGKISDLMGDVAKGIKNFKKGMADDASPAHAEPAKAIESPPATAAAAAEPTATSTAPAPRPPEQKVG